MPATLVRIFLLITTFAVSFWVVYVRMPVSSIMFWVMILLFCMLIALYKPISNLNFLKNKQKNYFLFISSLFIQLLVLSSGGFQSIFFILLHLYALSINFLLGYLEAFVFLVFALLLMIVQAWVINPANINEDMGSVLLYISSFVVIVPLMILSARNYQFKDQLLTLLKKELVLKKSQQETVLEGLNELVLITDNTFNIISANRAAERILSISRAEILGRPLFSVLYLKDQNQKMVSESSELIKNLFSSQQYQSNFELKMLTKNNLTPKDVSVHIRPVKGVEGRVDQMTFIIDEKNSTAFGKAENGINIEPVRIKQQAMLEELKTKLKEKNLNELTLRVDLVTMAEQDLLLVLELEEEKLDIKDEMKDIAAICKNIFEQQKSIAETFKVEMSYKLTDFTQEDIEKVVPKGFADNNFFKITPDLVTSRFFTTKVDPEWLGILIQKLTQISILLTSGTAEPKVTITLTHKEAEGLVLRIRSNFKLSQSQAAMIFVPYFGDLNNSTNLRFGSGLEGILAKKLSEFLKLPFELNTDNEGLEFKLVLPKNGF